MSPSHRLVVFVRCVLIVAASGCASAGSSVDAPPPNAIPRNPAGVFAVTSALDIRLPAATKAVVDSLTVATTGPDEPTRYLLDHMLAQLPDGTIKTIALDAAPLVAAYLDGEVASIAPRFQSGITAIAQGLTTIATRLGTVETLRVDDTGAATRTVTAARFQVSATPTVVSFGDFGLADLVVSTHVGLDGAGHVTIPSHEIAFPYGALLRLGLDHAVIPSVDSTATNLTAILTGLVDCEMLGQLVSDRLGVGSDGLYTAACVAGMNAIATDIYARLAAIDANGPAQLALAGAAEGIDLDGDGLMDQVRAGVWTGALVTAGSTDAINEGTFTGSKGP
jgi:hypothetical protein